MQMQSGVRSEFSASHATVRFVIRKDHKVSESEKAFARDLAVALNGGDRSKLEVRRTSEFERTPEDPDICIDTLQCEDCPAEGISTYVTMNASLDEEQDEGELDHRIELVGAVETRFSDFQNLFPGIAQLAWLNQWSLVEGQVIQNVFSGLQPANMPHALVARPTFWPQLTKRFVVDGTEVEFWWVIPIHESERLFIENSGAESLLNDVRQGKVDVFNLSRQAVSGV